MTEVAEHTPKEKVATEKKRKASRPPEPLKVEITFTEELLGTTAGDPEVFSEFIASKAPEVANGSEEEDAVEKTVADIDDEIEKGSTIFPADEEGPFLWDYQIKGFFKDACGMLWRINDTRSSKLQAKKKKIDGLVFVTPRRIHLQLPDGEGLGVCERPLRGQTAQGERVALARSQTAPVGTKLVLTIECFNYEMQDLIEEWLDYGAFRGLGQWRNSGKGRFTYRLLE